MFWTAKIYHTQFVVKCISRVITTIHNYIIPISGLFNIIKNLKVFRTYCVIELKSNLRNIRETTNIYISFMAMLSPRPLLMAPIVLLLPMLVFVVEANLSAASAIAANDRFDDDYYDSRGE